MYPPTFSVASCEIWVDVHGTKFERVSHIPRGTKIDQRTERSNHSLVFTEVEAAKRLRISVFMLRRWRQENYAPPYLRIGGILHYSAADLQAFVMYTNLLPS